MISPKPINLTYLILPFLFLFGFHTSCAAGSAPLYFISRVRATMAIFVSKISDLSMEATSSSSHADIDATTPACPDFSNVIKILCEEM